MRSTLSSRPRVHAGFSLIELMIAMTVGLLLLTVLATVFDQTSSGRMSLERVTRLTENSRFAADVIGDDIRHAGFYGTFMPPTDAQFVDPSPCDWDVVDVARIGWEPNLIPPRYPAQLQGYDDPGLAVPALGCLPDRVPGTDVLIIRRASSVPTAGPAADVRNVYVQASQCLSDPAPFLRVSNTAAQFNLRTVVCDPAFLAPLRRYFVRVYYVANCNECQPSDGVRTLRRAEFTETGLRVVPLAEGVENFQIEYAFDTNADGTPEQFLTTTTGGALPTSFWSNVVAVRLHLLLRSTEQSAVAATSPAVYDLGPAHNAETCPAGFKCRSLSTLLRLNNVAGRRES